MSTKRIRALVEELRAAALRDDFHTSTDLIDVERDIEAIEKNCRILDDHGVVHSMRFDVSKEDDELNDAADFLSAIGRPTEES